MCIDRSTVRLLGTETKVPSLKSQSCLTPLCPLPDTRRSSKVMTPKTHPKSLHVSLLLGPRPSTDLVLAWAVQALFAASVTPLESRSARERFAKTSGRCHFLNYLVASV